MRVLKFIIVNIKPYRMYITGILFATCVITIDNTFKPFLVKQFIDIVSNKTQGDLWLIFTYYALLQFMLVIAWTMSDYCITRYTVRFRLDVMEHFLKRLYEYPYSFFQNQLSGSLSSRINDAFQHLPSLVFTMINSFIYFMLLTLISLTLLFSVAPVFALSMISWITIFFAIHFISTKKSMLFNRQYAEEKSRVIGLAADYLGNIVSVKLFANRAFEKNLFFKLKKPFVDIAEKGVFIMSGFTPSWGFLHRSTL